MKIPYKKCLACLALCVSLPAYSAQSLLPVESHQQTTDWTCGPSVSLTVLKFWNRTATEEQLAKMMESNSETGTRPEGIVKYFQEHGFDVTWGTDGTLDMLKESVAQKIPVLVEWIDWGGHWVAVVGYDDKGSADIEDDDLILADPYDRVDGNPDGLVRFNAVRFDTMWFDALYFKGGKGITKGIWIKPIPKQITSIPTR